MKNLLLIIFLLSLVKFTLNAQTVYVDALKGRDDSKGTVTDPFSSLEKAVAQAKTFRGNEPITIKIAPGLYVLHHPLEIRTGTSGEDTVHYTIEASIMPDDPEWLPSKMPVIQSVSIDNSSTQFNHCVGILVAKNNVSIKGLKFVGNSNPEVRYYYPLVREMENYKNLEVSQCYFIGEKNSTSIQGAIWAHGAGVHVDHSIFYGCKNALLLFKSISDFSLTNSIIYGAYEAAVWFGPFNAPFVFQNNIVTKCNYFWLRPESTQPSYHFSNSLISENVQLYGYYTKQGAVAAPSENIKETAIVKSGSVLLSEVKTEGLPINYLNMIDGSAGKDIPAGIFKKLRK